MRSWLKELLHYRELLYFLLWRDLKVRYKQTALGVAWAILQPLLGMVIFTLIFGRVAKMPSEGAPYPLFVYPGLLAWTFFSNAINQGGNSLVSSSSLLTKVYFPRASIPIAAVLGALFDTCISMVLLAALMLYYSVPVSFSLLLIVPFFAVLFFCAVGLSLLLSAINVRYRDVKYALPFLVQIWMFLTPVIYPIAIVPDSLKPFLALNPVTGIVEGLRAAILPGKAFDWTLIGSSLVVSLLIVTAGALYFRKQERVFADII